MKFHTEVNKTFHGWKADTIISEISGVDKQLQILTMKRSNGVLCTTIGAVTVNNIPVSSGMVQSVCIEWDDYKGPHTYHTEVKRVTEKSVKQKHMEIVEQYQIEGLNHPHIQAMIAHYKQG